MNVVASNVTMDDTLRESGGRLILDEPESVYFRRELDVASNSGLKLIDERSPAHYLHWCQHPELDEEKTTFDFGHGLHGLVLEPHLFDTLFCILPEDAPSRPTSRQIKAAKPAPATIAQIDWWAQWDAEHQGMTMLTAKQYDDARGMVASLRGHVLNLPDSSGKVVTIRTGELLDLCQKEVTLRWTDRRTGIKCKGRADLDCPDFAFMGDVKSTENGSPDAFARSITTYRYHQQHVHYMDGAATIGEERKYLLFFAIEKKAPYVPGVYYVPAMAEERGQELRNRALDKLRRCLDTGTWPPYSNEITESVLPAWAYYD